MSVRPTRKLFIMLSALSLSAVVANLFQLGSAWAALKPPVIPIKTAGQKIIFKGKRYTSLESSAMLIWKLDSKQPLVNKEITGYFLMNKSKLVENTPQIIATHDLSGNAISVLVAQVKGLVTTHSTICTHLGCTVGVNGGGILCPCHGSQYNAMTGAVTHGPALRPLAPFPSKVIDGEIYVLGK